MSTHGNESSSDTIQAVQDAYGSTARSGLSSNDAGIKAVAEAFGYSADELASIPAEANMGLSCGNPIAMASINEGETVVDLGSGGGLDVFLAAQKVGANGKAIGIDMTQDMIDLANRNAQKGPDGQPITNVQFKMGQIDDMPLEDKSTDVIISNCVINLAPDKSKVFDEMFRVLKPGGRVAVSDIALKKELPPELHQSVAAYVGCFAGAIPIADYQQGLREAGFSEVVVVDSNTDLNAYAKAGASGCCAPGECCAPSDSTAEDIAGDIPEDRNAVSLGMAVTPEPEPAAPIKPLHVDLADLLTQHNINEYAASVKVFAVKRGCDDPGCNCR